MGDRGAVDANLITYENRWGELAKPDSYYGILSLEQILGFYTSALDTGDLDADGYDEIALAYSNQILSVDPGAGEPPFQIVSFDSTWFSNAGPDSSIVVGDVDLDGRAEILSEMYMEFYPDYSPKLSLFRNNGGWNVTTDKHIWSEESQQ